MAELKGLDDFAVVEELGKGAFGLVMKCRVRSRLTSFVAVKLMRNYGDDTLVVSEKYKVNTRLPFFSF
jgi:hypothetical protein